MKDRKREVDDIAVEVRKALRNLRRLDAEAGTEVEARAHYNQRVYRRAVRWSRLSSADAYASCIDIQQPTTEAFIEVILRLTSSTDRRLRQRHGLALKYAATRKVTPDDLPVLLDRCGGYAGCAARFRKRGAKRRNRRLPLARPELDDRCRGRW